MDNKPSCDCSTSLSRRNFLQLSSAVSLGIVGATVKVKGASDPYAFSIPSYLPPRLAICYYGWDWITSALPDEPYGDLERAMKETKERGFNCVRAEMGLDWMFDLQGQRRGRVKFTSWIPGFSSNLQCVNGRGGTEFDVFERVIHLFELAAKHDMYVIATSWEYQDSISQVASARIRDEILSVPYNDRLMHLARQYHRLLTELEKRNFEKRIAQVELINELNSPPIVCSEKGNSVETFAEWVQGTIPTPPCPTDKVQDLASNGVAYLRARHPELLITVDGLVACKGFPTLFPENAQVADHHVYSDGITQAFWRAAGISGFRPEHPPSLAANHFLRAVLKPHPIAWTQFVERASRVRRGWWGIDWLYENLDNRKFDQWCAANYLKYKKRIKDSIDGQFRCAAEFARPRHLPLVVDEGYILYPPLHSRFVMTPEGRWGEEIAVDAAISTGHWGITPTGYFRPNTPPWQDDDQCGWVRGLNRRILTVPKANA